MGYYRSLEVLATLILVLMANALGFFSSRFCLLTTLHRLGLLSSSQGAPPGTVETLETVAFDPEHFGEDKQWPKECPVCIADFTAEGTIRRTCCNHVFHEICLKQWLAVARSCPCCRTELTPDSESRVTIIIDDVERAIYDVDRAI